MRCYLVEKRCGEYIPANDYYQSTLDWDSYLIEKDRQEDMGILLELTGLYNNRKSKKLNKYKYEN